MTANYLATFAIALAVSLLMTPTFVRLAFKWGAVDMPGPRRVNVKPTARMGGPAMFIAFAAALLAAGGDAPLRGPVILGSFLALCIGLVDDVRSLRALPKLIAQIAVACLVFFLGIRVQFVTNPAGGVFPLPLWLSFAVTVAWLVGVTNAVNLIDGLDGLAAGIVNIASLTFFLVAASRGQTESAIMALALVGASAGFLRWNFYPSKTFMGDSGAYFLGFTAAALAVTGAFKITSTLTLLIPIFALGVPIFDTGFAIARRLYGRKPVMSGADKEHLHHRFLARGWHHRDAVILCYLITFALSAVSLAIIKEWLLAFYLMLSVAAVALLLIGIGKVVKKNKPKA
jgi:UDP-GlcNAc:undecaprenyl-phosphate GlcNAc-1-phosphate transferase